MKVYSLAVIILFTSLTGCRKSSNRATSSLDFSYSGGLYAYKSISFTSNAPTGSAFFWNFGDGTTSTAAMPKHIFKSNALFAVTLIVNNDSLHPISKKLYIGSATQMMVGTYNCNTVGQRGQNIVWPIDHSLINYTTNWPFVKVDITKVNDSLVIVADSFDATPHRGSPYQMVDSLGSDTTIVFRNNLWPFVIYDFKNDHIYYDYIFVPVSYGYVVHSFKLR